MLTQHRGQLTRELVPGAIEARVGPEGKVAGAVEHVLRAHREDDLGVRAHEHAGGGHLAQDPVEHGAVVRILGPYVVSGGWWQHELHREYHYAELRRGDCLWVYYDRNRRRWFCQGAVE